MNIKRFLTKQILVISLSIFCLLAVIISTSYASFTSSSGTAARTIQSGDLTTEFTEGNMISINPVPLANNLGEETDSYTFTITNNGTVSSYFRIDLHSTFGYDDSYLHYLEYSLKENDSNFSENKIVEYPDIDIYSATLEPGDSMTFELRVWMRANTPNELQGENANIKINVQSHVKQAYRGLDEAIKEDSLVRETSLPDSSNQTYYDINTEESYDYYDFYNYQYATSYTFDETSGTFTLNDPLLYKDSQDNFVFYGTYTCEDDNNYCSNLYYIDSEYGEEVYYHTIESTTSYQGLYKDGEVYRFIDSSKNYLKYNNQTYQIDSVDADGYITLKDNSSILSLNWLDLTVSGIGTEDDPYVVYNG